MTNTAQEAAIVMEAMSAAAEYLNVPPEILGSVVGLSTETISRIKNKALILDPKSKNFELALLFLRFYRSLYGFAHGDQQTARSFLIGHNLPLNGRPIELIEHPEGLINVINYLDARRVIL